MYKNQRFKCVIQGVFDPFLGQKLAVFNLIDLVYKNCISITLSDKT
jgi:hypothetical protein